MKGIFEMKPPSIRYEFIWDVDVVLKFLSNLYPNEDIPLDYLTHKLVMLLALATKQRAQTLHVISIKDIRITDNVIVIHIKKLLKHSRQGNLKQSLILKPYVDPSICVVKTMNEYIKRTEDIRGNYNQLFISFQKPHKPVSRDSISRWIKKVLLEAGIDTSMFKAHSTRAASSSAAKRDCVPIEEIMKSAGWSNSNTFHKFYDKIIITG